MPPEETWVAIRLAAGENRALAAERPEVFCVPHHYRNSTMVVVDLAAVDRAELAELLTEAWRLRAPARLRAAFDAGRTVDRVASGLNARSARSVGRPAASPAVSRAGRPASP